MSIAAVIQLWHVLCQVTLNSRFCCYTDWLNAGWKFSAVYIIWFVASSCFRVMEHVELRGHSRASTVFFFSNCCSSAIYPQRLLHICSHPALLLTRSDFSLTLCLLKCAANSSKPWGSNLAAPSPPAVRTSFPLTDLLHQPFSYNLHLLQHLERKPCHLTFNSALFCSNHDELVTTCGNDRVDSLHITKWKVKCN